MWLRPPGPSPRRSPWSARSTTPTPSPLSCPDRTGPPPGPGPGGGSPSAAWGRFVRNREQRGTMIKVGVLGARGRMGSEVCRAVDGADDLELSAAVDVGDDRDPLTGCDVVVDFTHPGTVTGNLQWCLQRGLDVVVGTSGFDEPRLVGVREMLGDPPSARALLVPDATVSEVPGARGAALDGVRVHSVRLAGLVAHQEVLLGGHGEILTIRHDSLDRSSFMPGVLLAVRGIAGLPAGLPVGLEGMLGLA